MQYRIDDKNKPLIRQIAGRNAVTYVTPGPTLAGAFKMLFVQPSVGCGEEVSAAGQLLCPPCAPRRRKRRRRRMRRVEEEGEEEDEDRVATCLHSH
jgi:hypothetical protein